MWTWACTRLAQHLREEGSDVVILMPTSEGVGRRPRASGDVRHACVVGKSGTACIYGAGTGDHV